MERGTPEQARNAIAHLAADRIPVRFGWDPIDDIQVLNPMHRGAAGADELNRVPQEAFNPGRAELIRGNRIFRLNDKVMQIRDDYGKSVFRGDLGRITALCENGQGLEVCYDGRVVAYGVDELYGIVTAYAVSVYKCLESEFPAVPVLTQHYVLLQRNLICTALGVVLAGTCQVLAMAVACNDQRVRHSSLYRRLAA